MVTKIEWRKKALRFVEEKAIYLETEFSEQTAINFVSRIEKTIEKVAKNPKSYRKVVLAKSVYFINIDKQNQMFYRVAGDTLIISAFFDMRQDPKKRPFK